MYSALPIAIQILPDGSKAVEFHVLDDNGVFVDDETINMASYFTDDDIRNTLASYMATYTPAPTDNAAAPSGDLIGQVITPDAPQG